MNRKNISKPIITVGVIVIVLSFIMDVSNIGYVLIGFIGGLITFYGTDPLRIKERKPASYIEVRDIMRVVKPKNI